MKQIRDCMGMPIIIEIVGENISQKIFKEVFDYFIYIDQKFSPYKKTSEVSKINSGELDVADVSNDMHKILELCQQTKTQTHGFFDAYHNDTFDPSGIVKGWAIWNASKIIKNKH